MQATEPTNLKIQALVFKAMEIKQASDHCSGQSETWTEINLDAFSDLLVEECISVIERHVTTNADGLLEVEAIKLALRKRFERSVT